jgi:hypothetical protein
MKYKWVLFICIVLISCNQVKIDTGFKSDFFDAINTIESYEKMNYLAKNESPTDSALVIFFSSQSYLYHLTGVFANVEYLDPMPFYRDRSLFLEDKRKWLEWYEKNKYNVTKIQSDSIKNIVRKSNIWW